MNSTERLARGVANSLTLTRFALGCYITAEIASNNITPLLLVLFGIGLITDIADGAIVKKFGIPDKTGSSLDLIADVALQGNLVLFITSKFAQLPSAGIPELSIFVGTEALLYFLTLPLINSSYREHVNGFLGRNFHSEIKY